MCWLSDCCNILDEGNFNVAMDDRIHEHHWWRGIGDLTKDYGLKGMDDIGT